MTSLLRRVRYAIATILIKTLHVVNDNMIVIPCEHYHDLLVEAGHIEDDDDYYEDDDDDFVDDEVVLEDMPSEITIAGKKCLIIGTPSRCNEDTFVGLAVDSDGIGYAVEWDCMYGDGICHWRSPKKVTAGVKHDFPKNLLAVIA